MRKREFYKKRTKSQIVKNEWNSRERLDALLEIFYFFFFLRFIQKKEKRKKKDMMVSDISKFDLN